MTERSPWTGGTWTRPILFGLAVAILVGGLVVGWLTWQAAATAGRVGADLTLYLDATRSALAGHGFYPAHQLAGPYTIADGDILYPPPVIALFAPFLVLPAVLFWIVPTAIVAAVVLHHRPRPWTWPVMAFGLAFPITTLKLVHGNPVMWITAATALGTVYAWPAVLVLVKPSLAPFALIGVRHRSWWQALAVGVVISAAFGPLWLDYARVVLDSHNPAGALYSLDEMPLLMVPVIACIGSPGFRAPVVFGAFRRRRAAT